MTPARQRQARLARILKIRKATLRAAEAGFSTASARAGATQTRACTVQELITTAATPATPGLEAPLATLRGAASLRALLGPVLVAATDHARSEDGRRQQAASKLADEAARHERTLRDFADARSSADREAEDRENAERAPSNRRRP